MGQTTEKKSFRTDFVLLLHLSIIAFFAAGWLVFVAIMALSGERILHYAEDYFIVFIFPLIFGAFLSVIAVALSNVLRQKWWIALFGTIVLLGTPLIAWVITWIGKQIARFFYLATPSDLEKTILVLNMKVRPRKEKEAAVQDFDFTDFVEELPAEAELIAESTVVSTAQVEVKTTKPVIPQIFSLWQCAIAALFGGVLAGGLMLSVNYKHLQERRNYITGVIVSLIAQFGLMILIIGLSYSDTTMVAIIPIVLGISIIVYIWYSELQQKDIDAVNLSNGIEMRSWWGVIGFVILSWIFVAIFSSLAEEIIRALDMPII